MYDVEKWPFFNIMHERISVLNIALKEEAYLKPYQTSTMEDCFCENS